jgi:hypothetical protein
MQRSEVRVVVNLGQQTYPFAMLEGELLNLVSRDGIVAQNGCIELPPMSLAVLTSTTEQTEDRAVGERTE